METEIPTISNNKELYLKEHPYEYNIFVMMRYSEDRYHVAVEDNIRRAFKDVGFYNPVFAKDLTPHYFENLADSIRQSIEMCRYGIAVLTPQEGTQFNPNVAFELGAMWNHGKQLLILKDRRVPGLFTNITSNVYEGFDGQLKKLQAPDNLLYKKARGWLERMKEIQQNLMNAVFVTGLENIIENPAVAIEHFEDQMWRCLKTVADRARLSLPQPADLRTAIKFLYGKGQLTAFIRFVMLECVRACEELKGAKRLSVEQRNRLLGWASLIRDIYNDWLRHYSTYLTLKKQQ